MTEISRPFTGEVGAGALGDAGPYSASQWWDVWKYLMPPDANSGVLIGSGTAPDHGLSVEEQSPAAAGVKVTAGRAMVQGTFYENTADINLSIAPNVSGLDRIDSIILRRNTTAQTIRLAVLQGTPALPATPPALTQGSPVYEIRLADVRLGSGFVTVTNANISRAQNFANVADGTYLLNVQNRSGITLRTGNVVQLSTVNDRSVIQPAQLGDPLTIGVWIGNTANLGYGRVLVGGIGYVKLDSSAASVARGDLLYANVGASHDAILTGTPSTTNPRPRMVPFAMALSTVIGSDANRYCLAYIAANLTNNMQGTINNKLINNGSSFTTTATTWGDIDASLSISHESVTGQVLIGFQAVAHHNTAGGRIDFDINVDGTRIGNTPANGLTSLVFPVTTGSGGKQPVSIVIPHTMVVGSSKTIKMQWQTSVGTASLHSSGSSPVGTPVIFWVKDI